MTIRLARHLFTTATAATASITLFVYACGGGNGDSGEGTDSGAHGSGDSGSPTGSATATSTPPGGGPDGGVGEGGTGGGDGDAGGTKTPRPASAYDLGINLPSFNYYNGAAIFADVALATSGNNGPWDSSKDSSKAATLDATGAPTEAASAAFTSDYPSGEYVMSWDGTGSFSVNGAKLGTVTKTTVNGTQHNVATLTFTQTLSTPTSPAFTQVTATPPVSNYHLVAPASLTEPSGVFMQDFATRMRPFTTLRFMDTLNTNNNVVQSWSERTWPGEGSRGGKPQGAAYEDIVAMANALGVDVWINVPVLATDDYVCRMARLFKYGEQGDKTNSACDPAAPGGAATTATLNPRSKVYVEFSNEIWNGGFQQIHDVYCMEAGKPESGHTCDVTKPTSAIAVAALASSQIAWSGDPSTKATELAVFLAKRDSDIFRKVFGCSTGSGCQAQIPFNVQSAYAAEVEPGFALMKKTYGSLSFLDAMAVAPYFGIDDDSTATSVAAVFSGIDANLAAKPAASAGNAIASWLAGDLAEANAYGLPLVAYEGGQGLSGATNQSNLLAAEVDPRMYDRYQTYFALWDAMVGRDHLFNHYSYVGSEGQYGSWGALIEQSDPGSQKFDAMLALTRAIGDANLDGVVDQADCAIARADFGKTTQFWMQGDFNHDATVDQKDLDAMNALITGGACVK